MVMSDIEYSLSVYEKQRQEDKVYNKERSEEMCGEYSNILKVDAVCGMFFLEGNVAFPSSLINIVYVTATQFCQGKGRLETPKVKAPKSNTPPKVLLKGKPINITEGTFVAVK